MKRDMDLIREILLSIEEFPEAEHAADRLEIDGYTPEEIAYHVYLLYQANLVEAHDFSTLGGFDWRPIALKWDGHEFLEAARDDTRWNSTKNMVVEKVGSLPFEVLKQVLLQSIRTAFF